MDFEKLLYNKDAVDRLEEVLLLALLNDYNVKYKVEFKNFTYRFFFVLLSKFDTSVKLIFGINDDTQKIENLELDYICKRYFYKKKCNHDNLAKFFEEVVGCLNIN